MVEVVAVVVMAGIAPVPVGPAAASVPAAIENAAASRAVRDLVGDHPWSVSLPEDFPESAGYRPVVHAGLLGDPDGDCSSPIRLPAQFRSACQAHDLGYDLLRYADNHGRPLGAWARQDIDAAFGRHLHATCAADSAPLRRLHCQTMATIADTAVDLNSRRQNYAAPRPEHLFGIRLSGKALTGQLLAICAPFLAAAALLGVTLTAILHRRSRRSAWTHHR